MSCLKFTLLFFLMASMSLSSSANLVQDFPPYNSAVLILFDEETPNRVCSAVAISKTRLLTSGHCIDHARKIQIVLDPEKDLAHRLPSPAVVSHRLHPTHKPENPESGIDLGVIHLKNPLPDSIRLSKVQPQVLRNLSLIRQSQDAKIIRFGFGERFGKNLRTAVGPLTFVSQNGNQLVFKDEFNAGGDSGGPVWLEQGKERVLIGIHSAVDIQDKTKTYSVALGAQVVDWILNK